MRGLVKSERYLMAVWDTSKGLKLPNDISSLAITANATNSDTGYIAVEYTFTNNKLCEEENQALKNESL